MPEPLIVQQVEDFSLASIMARKGVGPAGIADALGCPVAALPACTGDETLRVIATGPGTWLVLRSAAEPGWPSRLADSLADVASVSDQSAGYVIFRFTGEAAEDVLQRGVSIDLHPSAFGRDAVATTVIAHIGVILWRTSETSFEVALFRSFAASFGEWVDQAKVASSLASPF